MHWDSLPSELKTCIMEWRTVLMVPHGAARRIQRRWRVYRTRVLIGRFRMLRYLLAFQQWNPSVSTFLANASL